MENPTKKLLYENYQMLSFISITMYFPCMLISLSCPYDHSFYGTVMHILLQCPLYILTYHFSSSRIHRGLAWNIQFIIVPWTWTCCNRQQQNKKQSTLYAEVNNVSFFYMDCSRYDKSSPPGTGLAMCWCKWRKKRQYLLADLHVKRHRASVCWR